MTLISNSELKEQQQYIFDIVALHLLKQKKKSRVSNLFAANCVYRSSDGCKCSIGALIPDEIYEDSMESSTTPLDLLKNYGKVLPYFFNEATMPFMTHLQRLHDNYGVSLWENLLIKTAKEYDLTMPVSENVKK